MRTVRRQPLLRVRHSPSDDLRLLAVAAALALGMRSCTSPEYIVYRFATARCPDSTFNLPDSVTSGPYRLRVERRLRAPADCPAFKAYEFQEGTFSQNGVLLAFSRDSSCQLLVALRYQRDLGQPEPLAWGEAIARLSIGGVANETFTLVGKEIIGPKWALEAWCVKARESATLDLGTAWSCA